jgi:hypothetical protein
MFWPSAEAATCGAIAVNFGRATYSYDVTVARGPVACGQARSVARRYVLKRPLPAGWDAAVSPETTSLTAHVALRRF